MQTLLLILNAILLACTIGCLYYIIHLGRKIYRVLDDHSIELSEFRFCLAERILAWEKKSGYSYDNARKTYKKR